MKKLFIVLILSILSLSVITPSALAKSIMQSGERVEQDKDQIVDGDYFAAGESVIISGVVNGDAYVAGSNVSIEGTVNGDLIVAASNIDLRGNVTGDVRAAGANLTISGQIGGNLTVGAAKVFITDSASLGGSVVAGVGDMQILAPVAKDITAGVGKLYLAAPVAGDLTYWSEDELSLSPDATVSGVLTRHDMPKQDKRAEKVGAGVFAGMFAGFKLIQLVSFFVLGALLLRFAPVLTAGIITKTQARPWLAFFVGFVTIIMLPVTVLILFMTVVGIPLAFFLIALLMITCMFTHIFVAYNVGYWLLNYFRKSPNPYLALVVGLILYNLLLLVPVLGWLVMSILYLMALGGLVLYKHDFYRTLRTKKLL